MNPSFLTNVSIRNVAISLAWEGVAVLLTFWYVTNYFETYSYLICLLSLLLIPILAGIIHKKPAIAAMIFCLSSIGWLMFYCYVTL